MYWDNCTESTLVFRREETRIARKEHNCCECGRIIKKGEKYSYFAGLWDYHSCGNKFGAYKTCLECDEDWGEILCVFHNNGEEEARIVFGSLEEAVLDALDKGLLKEDARLIKKWLGEEREQSESQEAVAQMRVWSHQLL